MTLLTAPVARERLQEFFDRVQPPGFWAPFREGQGAERGFGLRLGVSWAGSTALVLACVLLPGDLLFQDGAHLGAWLVVAVLGALAMKALPRLPSRDAAGGA